MPFDGGQPGTKTLQREGPQLIVQMLNPDEGGDGKNWGEDEDDRREDAEKFHEKGARASRSWD